MFPGASSLKCKEKGNGEKEVLSGMKESENRAKRSKEGGIERDRGGRRGAYGGEDGGGGGGAVCVRREGMGEVRSRGASGRVTLC